VKLQVPHTATHLERWSAELRGSAVAVALLLGAESPPEEHPRRWEVAPVSAKPEDGAAGEGDVAGLEGWGARGGGGTRKAAQLQR
jgi:hypothetical protein